MARLLRYCAASLLLFSSLIGTTSWTIELPDQVVTWADFNYVRSVSTSIDRAYFATTEGIIVYNKLEQRWEEPLTGSLGLDDRSIMRIWSDRFGDKLYAQTETGYFEYDPFFQKWYELVELPQFENDDADINPPGLMFAPPGFIYENGGILDDPQSRRFELNSIVDDNSGHLWIGTWGMGAAQARSAGKKIDLLPYGLIQNGVGTIFNDSGVLWIGGPVGFSPRSGLTIFDPDRNTFDYIESGLSSFFPAVDINFLAPFGNYMLLGSARGLIYMNRETDRVDLQIDGHDGLADDNVLCLAPTGDSVYVGTEFGLNLVHGDPPKVSNIWPDEFFNHRIYDLLVIEDDLWIASSRGAYRLSLATGRLQKFNDPDNALFGEIYDLELVRGQLWFAANDLILKLDLKTAQTEVHRINTSSFRPRKIAVNDGIAAIATDFGLTIIFHDKDPVYERTFSIDDGLPSNTIYDLELDGDFLWIGSDHGLTRFWWNNPNRID